MNQFLFQQCYKCIVSVFAAIALSVLTFPASADSLSIFKKSIIEYNLKHLEKSLSDGSYRGEEGILRISPEIASSFGLKVVVNQDYLDSKELFEKADRFYKKAVDFMTTQEKESFKGAYARMIAKNAALYNESIELAREKLIVYRSKLSPSVDERLNEDICSRLLIRLLQECLIKSAYNLRDGLGCFYNRCRDIKDKKGPLNTRNIRFVNQVFHEFDKKAFPKDKERFDLDRYNGNMEYPGSAWEHVVGSSGFRYISFLESATRKYQKADCPVNPLLFVALMRRESRFNPNAVSSVGAAGLTQIMPGTARSLGMDNVFMPAYFAEARSVLVRERRFKNKARAILLKITGENMLKQADHAREMMIKSREYGKKRAELYARYKQELLLKGADDRLNPGKAIKFGLKYLAEMMKRQKGDISLALASYNAGPGKIKQYKGIPPYSETICYRNSILKYYRSYLKKLNNYHAGLVRQKGY